MFADESKKQREALSLRDAPTGSRKVSFRKPNQATTGLTLGLKFRESFGKAVYIDQIIPNSEAARLEKAGKLKKGDEVTMVSATFGNEMWSARGIGKYEAPSVAWVLGLINVLAVPLAESTMAHADSVCSSAQVPPRKVDCSASGHVHRFCA